MQILVQSSYKFIRRETILTAIEFLQACGPRLVELIEAGSQGFLSEATVVKCLEVNDELCKTLSDYQDMDKKISQPISNISDFTIDDDLKDLITDTHSPVQSQEGKTSGLGDDSKQQATKTDEDFDSFFDQRFNAKKD